MTQKSELGKLGEDLACKYLKKKGYKIVERNYWQPWGELDIVAISPEKILVLVEVKTVSLPVRSSDTSIGTKEGGPSFITAENQMTPAKLIKSRRAAELYANSSEFLTDKGWRIDLVAVTMDASKASPSAGRPRFDLKHYENI